MRVRILGPFHLEDGRRRITIGGVQQRAVLADLLLHAKEVVPSDQILVGLLGSGRMYPRRPGRACQRSLRTAVSALPSNCFIRLVSHAFSRLD